MKKTKLFSLLTLALIFSLLLTSCANQKAKKTLDTVFNPNYSETTKTLTEITEVKELEGYYLESSGHNVALTAQQSKGMNGTHTSYKVYNMLTKSVVLELSDKNYEYQVSMMGIDYYFIVRYIPNSTNTKEFFVAYDLMGNEIARSEYNIEYRRTIGDYKILNNTVYTVDKSTGRFEKVSTINAYSIPKSALVDATDEYFIFNYDNSVLSFYNTSFERIFDYTKPSYVEGFQTYVLNNSNVFFQGEIRVEDDSETYDYYRTTDAGETKKYELYQVLIDPAKKTVKELDLGCFVTLVRSREYMNSGFEDTPLYGEGLENIAYISNIVNKKIDSSPYNIDILKMDNNGKLQGSLKIIEGQSATLPKKISSERYLVSMVNQSYTLIDNEGNVIASNIISANDVGGYIVVNEAIYDLDMNLLYDAKNAPAGITATIYQAVYEKIFIRETNDTHHIYYIFINGEKQEIGKVPINESSYSLNVQEHSFLFTSGNKKYLYNNNGYLLCELGTGSITFVTSDNDEYLIKDLIGDWYLLT